MTLQSPESMIYPYLRKNPLLKPRFFSARETCNCGAEEWQGCFQTKAHIAGAAVGNAARCDLTLGSIRISDTAL